MNFTDRQHGFSHHNLNLIEMKAKTLNRLERIFDTAHMVSCFLIMIPGIVIIFAPIWLWFMLLFDIIVLKYVLIILLISSVSTGVLWWLTGMIWGKLYEIIK